MLELLEIDFIQNAIIVSLLASFACGIIGTYVIINRLVFISGGIAHTAFGGIGIAFYLGLNPLLGAMTFSLLASIGIGYISKKQRQNIEVIIGIIWALGMSIGIIFLNLTESYQTDLMSYLFGNILYTSIEDIYIVLILDIIILILTIVFYNAFRAISFDYEYSFIKGIPSFLIYLLLLILISMTIISLIQLVGIILVIAMLTIPTNIALLLTYKINRIMIISVVICMLFSLLGLILSFYLNLPSGASIIIISSIFYFTFLFIRKIKS